MTDKLIIWKQQLKEGKITQAEFDDLVNDLKLIQKIEKEIKNG